LVKDGEVVGPWRIQDEILILKEKSIWPLTLLFVVIL